MEQFYDKLRDMAKDSKVDGKDLQKIQQLPDFQKNKEKYSTKVQEELEQLTFSILSKWYTINSSEDLQAIQALISKTTSKLWFVNKLGEMVINNKNQTLGSYIIKLNSINNTRYGYQTDFLSIFDINGKEIGKISKDGFSNDVDLLIKDDDISDNNTIENNGTLISNSTNKHTPDILQSWTRNREMTADAMSRTVHSVVEKGYDLYRKITKKK